MTEAARPFRILLIEDNELDREFFREGLAEFNDRIYEFAEKETGKNAAEVCREFAPDCVILDYNLPHSDGLKILSELRTADGRPSYPVVMLTGRGNERTAVEAMQLGAQDYLVKEGLSAANLHRAVHNANERFHLTNDLQRKNTELEESLRQLRMLQEITAALSAGAHLADVAKILVEKGREIVGADTAIVLRAHEGQEVKVLAHHGYQEQDIQRWQPRLPEGTLPVADALLRGKEYFFEEPAQMHNLFPLMREVGPLRALQSFIALPLRQRDGIVASVGFGFKKPRGFEENEKVYLNMLLRACAEALERASLFEEEILRKEELARTVHIREEFLSVASHELKTPLTALKLQLQLARRGFNPETGFQPEARRTAAYFDSALRQVARLSAFIDDLLDVSKINAGKLVLERQTINLCRLVEEVSANFEEQLQKSGNQLEIKAEAECLVVGDPFRIEQVLNNLFSNAIKYAPGSRIVLQLVKDPEKVRLEFQDCGPGIPLDRLPFIFDRYERATSNHRISGLGLGLYITKQLVEAQEGSIEVESAEGSGTAFILRLPKSA